MNKGQVLIRIRKGHALTDFLSVVARLLLAAEGTRSASTRRRDSCVPPH
jgi:hypothetical protein